MRVSDLLKRPSRPAGPLGGRAGFCEKVYREVGKIPRGLVATYGQIASLVGAPRAARQVGWALRRLSADSRLPWWRVINSRGMISIENLGVPKREQVRRLQSDGVEVKLREGNYWVDLRKSLW